MRCSGEVTTSARTGARSSIVRHSIASGATTTVGEVIERLSPANPTEVVEQHWFFDSKCYDTFLIIVVAANTLALGLEIEYPDAATIWLAGEHLFTAFFGAELIGKLCAFRCRYFRDGWNCLDCTLAVLAVLDTWILRQFEDSFIDSQMLHVVRVVRMFRLARVLRLVGKFKRLIIISNAVAESMRTTAWASLLLGLCIYACAIFCVECVGRGTSDLYPGYADDAQTIDQQELLAEFNPHLMFGTMVRSMLTLFGIATLTEWREVVWPVIQKQPPVIMFFICFALFVTFGLMNVIVGMIVDGVMTKAKAVEQETTMEVRARRLELLRRVQMCVDEIDTDADGFISAHELEQHMQKSEVVKDLMNGIDLPQGWTSTELYAMLDLRGKGAVGPAAFLENLFRLIDTTPFQRSCIMQQGINEVKHMIRKSHERMSKMENVLLGLQVQGVRGEAIAHCESEFTCVETILPQITTNTRSMEISEGVGHHPGYESEPGNIGVRPGNSSFAEEQGLPPPGCEEGHPGAASSELEMSTTSDEKSWKCGALPGKLDVSDAERPSEPCLESLRRLMTLVIPSRHAELMDHLSLLQAELDERIKLGVHDELGACFASHDLGGLRVRNLALGRVDAAVCGENAWDDGQPCELSAAASATQPQPLPRVEAPLVSRGSLESFEDGSQEGLPRERSAASETPQQLLRVEALAVPRDRLEGYEASSPELAAPGRPFLTL